MISTYHNILYLNSNIFVSKCVWRLPADNVPRWFASWIFKQQVPFTKFSSLFFPVYLFIWSTGLVRRRRITCGALEMEKRIVKTTLQWIKWERYMSGIKEFEFKARGYSGSRTKLRRRAGGTGSGGRSLGKTSWYSGGKRKTTTITRGRD